VSISPRHRSLRGASDIPPPPSSCCVATSCRWSCRAPTTWYLAQTSERVWGANS
jgi:hypothetical protein